MNTQLRTTPNKDTDRVICLFGPTGSGKTAVLEALNGPDSKQYACVNADSIQVYRGLDIGSAKADENTLSKIDHYLIDIREPWEQFSVGDFVEEADRAIFDIRAKNQIPIISGGTAYYFKHFLYGLPEAPKSNPALRAAVQQDLEERGKESLYEELKSVDPVSAARININDVYRITRALEVYRSSGRPLSEFRVPSAFREGIEPVLIEIDRPNSELKERIALRVDEMFRMGLQDEIERLKAEGAEASWPGMQGIGYREFFDPELKTPDEIRAAIIIDSVKYAKRQKTFFKTFPDLHVFSDADSIISFIRSL